MSYINVELVLPEELVAEIQKYIDGEYLYIPKLKERRKSWGENTNTRKEMNQRNQMIYQEYENGLTSRELAQKYYLSIKSIQRIILNQRKKCG